MNPPSPIVLPFALPDSMVLKAPWTQEEWDQVQRLRFVTLRQPHGYTYDTARDSFDPAPLESYGSSMTLALWNTETGQALATARFEPVAAPVSTQDARYPEQHFDYPVGKYYQVRYVAVIPTSQKKGLGTLMMQGVEAALLATDCQIITLDARQIALPLYRKLGYQIVKYLGIRHREVPHYQCIKVI